MSEGGGEKWEGVSHGEAENGEGWGPALLLSSTVRGFASKVEGDVLVLDHVPQLSSHCQSEETVGRSNERDVS